MSDAGRGGSSGSGLMNETNEEDEPDEAALEHDIDTTALQSSGGRAPEDPFGPARPLWWATRRLSTEGRLESATVSAESSDDSDADGTDQTQEDDLAGLGRPQQHDEAKSSSRSASKKKKKRKKRVAGSSGRTPPSIRQSLDDLPLSGVEERRRAVLGAGPYPTEPSTKKMTRGRRSEGSSLRPIVLQPSVGSPIMRALFRTAEQEFDATGKPQLYPRGTVAIVVSPPEDSTNLESGQWTPTTDLTDYDSSHPEHTEHEHDEVYRKKRKKKHKNKKRHENQSDELKRDRRKSRYSATFRRPFVFPIDGSLVKGDSGVPFSVWLYETVLRFLWPPFNYFRLHLLYICMCALIGGVLIHWTQGGSMSFIDALFLSTSAVTTCGLVTTNMGDVSGTGQLLVLILIILGNFVLLTLPPVLMRLYYFRKFFRTTGIHYKRRVVEYQALKWFATIVPLYYCAWVGLATLIITFYFLVDSSAKHVLDRYDTHPAWWALFHSASSFSNAGIATTPTNFLAWQDYPFPLIVCSFLILAGNTAYPLMMRFIVYCLYRSNRFGHSRPIFRYILDHPRRCFTHLFPRAETRWLLLVLIFLNSAEFLFEIVLDWFSPAYIGLSSWSKLVNMYFQTISIRAAGFNSVDIPLLNAALLWLYTGMMYISATPVAIAVRYTGASRAEEIGVKRGIPMNNTLAAQAQNIFVKHTIVLFLAVLFIIMIEEIPLQTDPEYSIFKIVFEVVSAYGPVGLSIGYNDNPYSFSGAFLSGSKFIIIVVMILGKHRGLPDSIDSAISLPSNMQEPQDDLEIGIRRRRSRVHKHESDSEDEYSDFSIHDRPYVQARSDSADDAHTSPTQRKGDFARDEAKKVLETSTLTDPLMNLLQVPPVHHHRHGYSTLPSVAHCE